MASKLLMFAFASVVLFYWFRHHCASILRRRIPSERAQQVAEVNQLTFSSVAGRVGSASPAELDLMSAELKRDYKVLTCLLRYTAARPPGRFTFEQRLLMADFKMLAVWYAITRRFLRLRAARAIEERSRILFHLAALMGERSATLSGLSNAGTR